MRKIEKKGKQKTPNIAPNKMKYIKIKTKRQQI